jgi:hypothetical protein
MLAVGAVGAKAVQTELNARGHDVVELERGSLSTRIWRDVKRKRVRIPDLCCTRCGVRVESRAKTRPDLAMSHSPREAERAWDYGMLDGDWIAFPILVANEEVWSEGLLKGPRSLWRERTRTSWARVGVVNVFRVGEFRSVAPKQQKPKGVTEGSEIQVSWKGRFAKANGEVTSVREGRLDYKLVGSRKENHFRLGSDESAFLEPGDEFMQNQVVAGQVRPLAEADLRCPSGCDEAAVARMLRSRERTVRFTGCKLARLQRRTGLDREVRALSSDPEEDPYVQMEARTYLCDVVGDSAAEQFRATLLTHTDDQMRLEAAVALAETRTSSSFDLLLLLLQDRSQPLFLRSACAWALGCHGTEQAAQCLVSAFADVAPEIREEAMTALLDFGTVGVQPLIKGLGQSPDVAAGSAEALRRLRNIPVREIARLAETSNSTWPTWTLAHLPKDSIAPHIAALQTKRPDVHFALTVLWTFLESWIAENWTPGATP